MPRYYFHAADLVEILDEQGFEVSCPSHMRTGVVVALGEALLEHGTTFWSGPELRLWVTNEDGTTVFALRLSVEERPDVDG